MMGTRSGDLDPSVVGFLARKEGVDAAEVEGWLNTRSGLLGVSGTSRDMRELLEAESRGDGDASLAIDMFCYRARKYVGSYLAVLGGADAVIFGGGIGENAPEVRARICEGMNWCGLALDAERNDSAVGSEVRISAEGSSTQVGYEVHLNVGLSLAGADVERVIAPIDPAGWKSNQAGDCHSEPAAVAPPVPMVDQSDGSAGLRVTTIGYRVTIHS